MQTNMKNKSGNHSLHISLYTNRGWLCAYLRPECSLWNHLRGAAGPTAGPSAPDTLPSAPPLPSPEDSSTTEPCWPAAPPPPPPLHTAPPGGHRAPQQEEQWAMLTRNRLTPRQSHPDPFQSIRPWNLDWNKEHQTVDVSGIIPLYFKVFIHFDKMIFYKNTNLYFIGHSPVV